MFISSAFLIFFVLISKSSPFENHPNCGQSLSSKKFIVSGEDATTGEFPFMAYCCFDSICCGGVIIHERWVLTAAHCLHDLDPSSVNGSVDVEVGAVHKGMGKSYDVQAIFMHGCFHTTIIFQYDFNDDIALLLIKGKIAIDNQNVGTICLPKQGRRPVSRNVTSIGWGSVVESNLPILPWPKLGEEDDIPSILQKTTTELVPASFCQIHTYFRWVGAFQTQPKWDLDKILCLQSTKTTSCRGDSGGPVFQRVNGRYYHLGISSFQSGWLFSLLCFKGNPNIYTKTSAYIDWIDSVVNNKDNWDAEGFHKMPTEC